MLLMKRKDDLKITLGTPSKINSLPKLVARWHSQAASKVKWQGLLVDCEQVVTSCIRAYNWIKHESYYTTMVAVQTWTA